VLPARALGARAYLVRSAQTEDPGDGAWPGLRVVGSLAVAVDDLLAREDDPE
jgi:hypothetical protein